MGELLKRVTDKLGLQVDDHFLCFDSTTPNSFVPNRSDKLADLVCLFQYDDTQIDFRSLDLFIN